MGKFKFKNRKFPKEFKTVAKYIEDKKGVLVTLGHYTAFLGHFTREIVIHHNYDLKNNGLFALLHECGHSLQPPTNVGINSYKNLDETEHPDEYRMGRFLNEVDAWNRGFALAGTIGIPIDKRDWNLQKERALLTYFDR